MNTEHYTMLTTALETARKSLLEPSAPAIMEPQPDQGRPMDQFRRTGRTTRMLNDALLAAHHGARVAIVGLDYSHCEHLFYTISGLQGRNTHSHGSLMFREHARHEVGDRGGHFQMFLYHPRLLDMDHGRLRFVDEWGMPTIDALFVDHWVLEQVYKPVFDAWSRHL